MSHRDRGTDRQIILHIPWRRLRIPMIGMLLLAVGGLWAGHTDNMGILTATVSLGRGILIGLGYFILVAMPVLLISNLVQDWAILVGTESGLQAVYPLGLHRLMPKSRLVGDLVDAELHVSKTDARGRFQPAQLAFEVRASEGTLRFRVNDGGVNDDYERRFAEWLSTRRDTLASE